MDITNNKKLFRFEIALAEGEFATLSYRWLKGNMVLMQTLVPAAARGQGLAGMLAKYALENAREHGLQVVVYCHFVADYLKEHPEYNDVVAQP